MKKLTLQFPSMIKLWKFKQQAHLASVDVLTQKKMLICQLPRSDLELATGEFKAQLVEEEITEEVSTSYAADFKAPSATTPPNFPAASSHWNFLPVLYTSVGCLFPVR